MSLVRSRSCFLYGIFAPVSTVHCSAKGSTPLGWMALWLVSAVGLVTCSCLAAEEDLNGIIGVGPVSFPRYASGQDRRTSIAPFYIVGWGERFDLDSFNGATVWVAKIGGLKVGPNLTYAPGVDKAPGLDRISARPMLGVRVEWDVAPWFDVFTGAGSEVFVPSRGFAGNLGVEGLYEFNSTWSGYSGARLTWGNARYQANYFGVSNAEASQTNYPAYSPTAGLTELSIDQYIGFRFATRWVLVGGASYARLLGPSAVSPTVTLGGHQDQWVYGLFLSYKF